MIGCYWIPDWIIQDVIDGLTHSNDLDYISEGSFAFAESKNTGAMVQRRNNLLPWQNQLLAMVFERAVLPPHVVSASENNNKVLLIGVVSRHRINRSLRFPVFEWGLCCMVLLLTDFFRCCSLVAAGVTPMYAGGYCLSRRFLGVRERGASGARAKQGSN